MYVAQLILLHDGLQEGPIPYSVKTMAEAILSHTENPDAIEKMLQVSDRDIRRQAMPKLGKMYNACTPEDDLT